MPTPPAPEPPAGRANARLQAVRERLGQEPDGTIAAELGVARKTVILFRQRLGIPAYQGVRTGPGRRPPSTTPRAPRPSRLDAFRSLVGTLSDREVAEQAGVTAENVRMYRLRRDIPAGWRNDAPPAPTADPPPSVRPGRRGEPQQVFRITAIRRGDRHHFGVVAADVVDAAERARAALVTTGDPWVIQGIRLVGSLLPDGAEGPYSLAAATSTTS